MEIMVKTVKTRVKVPRLKYEISSYNDDIRITEFTSEPYSKTLITIGYDHIDAVLEALNEVRDNIRGKEDKDLLKRIRQCEECSTKISESVWKQTQSIIKSILKENVKPKEPKNVKILKSKLVRSCKTCIHLINFYDCNANGFCSNHSLWESINEDKARHDAFEASIEHSRKRCDYEAKQDEVKTCKTCYYESSYYYRYNYICKDCKEYSMWKTKGKYDKYDNPRVCRNCGETTFVDWNKVEKQDKQDESIESNPITPIELYNLITDDLETQKCKDGKGDIFYRFPFIWHYTKKTEWVNL